MVPYAGSPVSPEEATHLLIDPPRVSEDDPVRRFVQVTLALYLTPVIVVVCLIGGVSILFEKVDRLVSRTRGKDASRLVGGSRVESTQVRFKRDRERTRIGH